MSIKPVAESIQILFYFMRLPRDPSPPLEEFIAGSQKSRADALKIVLLTVKSQSPAFGGLFFWMIHDAFPCTANLSIIDFDGNPKLAALAPKSILRNQQA